MRLALALLLASFAVTPSGLAPAAWAQGRAGAETEEEQAFQAAEAAFNSGRFDDAAPLYERAITLNPSRGEAWIKRAVIHYKQRQYNEAVQLLRRGQQAVPGDLGIKAQLGLSLYRSGAQDVAVGLLEEVVAARPGMPDVQLQLATHYVRIGDGKKAVTAIEAYGRARTGEAPDPETQIQIRLIAGSAYLLNRQHPEAEREFDAVLKLRPGDEVARLSLGQVFAARGDCSQAITIYERLLQLAPKKPFVYFDLGNCYLKVNRRVEAEKMAAAYTQQRPKEAKGFLLLGDTRLESRDFAGALGAYEQARKLEPAAGTVDARMGKAYLGQRNFPAAVAVLEKALAARPGEVEIMTQLADAYAATRQPAEKLLAIGRELQRVAPPTDSEALTGSGLAYYAAGEDAQAAQIFAAALQANPSARRARTGLQMALTRGAQGAIVKGEIARAEELLERALKLDPEALQANRNLALVQIMARKFEPAAKLLEGLLKKVPRDQVVNRLLGRALLGLKRPADAVRAYETAAQSAQRNRGPALAEINAELGLLYLETGKVDQAVATLESAAAEAGKTAALTPAQRNLAIALHRRGLERLGDPKQADAALDDLTKAAATPRPILAPKEQNAFACAAIVAAIRAGKSQVAEPLLTRLQREKESCTLKAPFDKMGMDFLNALAQYRDNQDPDRREMAARTFQRLSAKASGSQAVLLRDLTRSAYELEGFDLFQRGDDKRAAVALRAAAKLGTKGEHRELDHNLAVIDVVDGKTAQPEKVFEELGSRPPEALVNLGLLVDKQGDPKRALELFRRGAERGARAPKLRDWIDVKERLLVGGAK